MRGLLNNSPGFHIYGAATNNLQILVCVFLRRRGGKPLESLDFRPGLDGASRSVAAFRRGRDIPVAKESERILL